MTDIPEEKASEPESAEEKKTTSKTKKLWVLRIVAFVLCVAIVVAVFTLPSQNNGGSSSSSEYSGRDVPTSETVAAYKEKKAVLNTGGTVAIIVPADEPSYVKKLKKELKEFGLTADVYTWEKAEESAYAVFNPMAYKAVIYTDAGGVPEGLIQPISSYLNNDGGLICIGGPAFTDIYSKTGSVYVKVREMEGAYGTNKNNQYSGELLIDCLSPAYHTFPVTNAVKVVSRDVQAVLPEADYAMPSEMFSCSPRTYGTGILKYRTRRFVPLIEALDAKGETAGYLAYMVLSLGSDVEVTYNSGMWASFNTNDKEFLGSAEALSAISCVAAYFNVRKMFFGGGASEYTYFPGDEWTVGAETMSEEMMFGSVDSVNTARSTEYFTVNLEITREGTGVFEKEFQPYEFENVTDTAIGTYTLYSTGFTPQEAGDYRVTAELRCGKTVIDRLAHDVCVYAEKPESERKYVTAVGKDLYLDGKVWKCYGVNYMPSSGISLIGDDYEKWVSPSAFDIDIVSKDLRRIKDIGFNAVSVFAYDCAIGNNTLITLIRLCEKYGLKVFFSFREFANPVTFIDGNAQTINDMITGCKLAGNDTLVGYDIAWETMPGGYGPCWCNDLGMMAFDEVWSRWVVDNYGSLDAAESAWGWSPGRNAGGTMKGVDIGTLAGRNQQASTAIIAYRRWLDDWCADIFGKVTDIIKDVDPNHLVAARNGMYTGWPNGRFRDVGWEYGALASALDVMGPEGYGYYYQWDDDFETAVYSVAYSRYSCDKPLIWFEFGKDAWVGTNYDNEYGLEAQANYIANINRVLKDSQSNGIFYWWYAGGFRLGEASDYGIINPDGSDRKATTLIREFADEFKNAGKVREPQVTVEADRDEYAYGVVSMYFGHQSDFKAANNAGKVFGITNRGDSMTSLNAELSRISDLDIGPLRFLNATIRRVWYRVSGGEWILLKSGDVITAPRGSKVELKLTVVNTGRAKWICRANAGSSAGAVCVNVGGESFDIPSDAARHALISVSGISVTADNYKTVTLEMAAEGRAHFGEKIKFTIKTV
ncbi:MAG: hypothetical protein J5756_05970 [Clostridia bacterium]|nr:hypothetical protein [Clostridia bacterium]